MAKIKRSQLKKKPQNLMLKIRVTVKRRMRKTDVIAKLLHAAETGHVPDDIDIAWIDWEKGSFGHGGQIRAGEEIEALGQFVNAIRQSSIRAERAN